jgi:hypothetical protein
MRRTQWRVTGALVLVAGILAGCGSGDAAKGPALKLGKVVQGESETGMKLKVESFVAPASDPVLKKLDAYRAAAGYPPVDYHRVTAKAAAMPDHLRDVSFAASANDLSAGKGVEGRFGCDVVSLEWVPTAKVSTATFNQLRSSLCKVAPSDPEGVAPGGRVVYYLVTDRGFSERNLRARKIFGPRNVEFVGSTAQ